MTRQEPPSPEGPIAHPDSLPDAPGAARSSAAAGSTDDDLQAPGDLPKARPFLAPGAHVVWDCDTESRHGDVYLLSGNVVITYETRSLRADTVTYNNASGELSARGHVRVTDTRNAEFLQATRADYNLQTGTGTFYEVSGSVGLTAARPPTAPALPALSGAPPTRPLAYTNRNPFVFSGRMVVKTGEQQYDVYDGSVTSCLLPNPDWQLSARRFSLDDKQASARGAVFHLLGLPVLFLPYASHPTDSEHRESGLLIPVLGFSNSSRGGSKGLTLGEQVYWALGRSADLTAGFEYFSQRGFSESATVRYRGVESDFISAHFSALQDRGYIDTDTGIYTNQGGEDVTASFRRKFTANTRAVGDLEYLSSYVYREAFTENFNQAVSSDITSIGYVVRQNNGYSLDGRADRYQGLKRVPIETVVNGVPTVTAGEQVRIFHAPSIDFTALEHPIAGTPLRWGVESSVAGLKRVQPNFVSSGIVERIDVQPMLELPLSGGGWHTMSSVALRDTFYSRSRQTPYGNGATPVELTQSVNRSDVDLRVEIRPPVVERTFSLPGSLQRVFGSEVRHTVEPEFTYRDVRGIGNFLSILRFDDIDLASDTDQLEYGLTQRLFFRPVRRPVGARRPKPGCPVEVHAGGEQNGRPPGEAAAGEPQGRESQVGEPQGREPQDGSAETAEIQAAIPDALEPGGDSSTDANGIPSISATAPDLPTRTHGHRANDCAPVAAPVQQQELFSWKLAQQHFFNQNFGGAVINGRRNIFDSTLELSGVAFLTEPRSTSPLISRMRLRTSSHTDLEWDFDLDTGASKFTSSNLFADAHEGPIFGGFSFARLNAPGRFYTIAETGVTGAPQELQGSATSDFSQVRFLLGLGTPSRPGLSAAGNIGIDLNAASAQYAAIQASYNWNCCGLSVEYRRYSLGSVREENAYRFNFTLANIGSAGNLRRTERLF